MSSNTLLSSESGCRVTKGITTSTAAAAAAIGDAKDSVSSQTRAKSTVATRQVVVAQHEPFPSSTSSFSLRHSTSTISSVGLLGLSDHANGGGRTYTPSSWAPTVITGTFKDNDGTSGNNVSTATTPGHSSLPQQTQLFPAQSIRPIFLRNESRESLSAPGRNSGEAGKRGGGTTKGSRTRSSAFYSGGRGGNDSATDLTSLYTIDQESPGRGGDGGGREWTGGGGESNGFYPARTSSPGTGSRHSPHYPRPLYRHSYERRHHQQDSSEDDGGIDSSYFGTAGSDFMLKRRRGQLTTTLMWIDVVCQCLWTIAAGLTLDNGSWIWIWSNVSGSLAALAGLRVMVLAFTVYFCHSNFNALVVLFCGVSTLFMVYGINSAIQHRIAMSLLLVGQYASSILVTQLYWISYSVHTPLSAALEWEYDPLLQDSITFSRESRLYSATAAAAGGYGPAGHLSRTNSFRRGTGYGAINYPIDPVAELDEETAEMGPDEFLKVDVTVKSQRHHAGAVTNASSSGGARSGNAKDSKGVTVPARNPEAMDNEDETSEASDEEQEMAVLLAFQEARRQQVFAFSPSASSSALPSRPVLSSSKDSDRLFGGGRDVVGGGNSGNGSGPSLSSYDRRMTGNAASRMLTMGHVAKGRLSSFRATGADAQSIGRRTWTGGRSIIFSGILVESSDEDEDDDDDSNDGGDKEERRRKKQLAKLGFGTLDSTSSFSVDGTVETAEILEDDNDDDDHREHDEEGHLGEWNTQVVEREEECHRVAHGDLPSTDTDDTRIKVEVDVSVSIDGENIEESVDKEVVSTVEPDNSEESQVSPMPSSQQGEEGAEAEVNVQVEVAINVDEEVVTQDQQGQHDEIHNVVEDADQPLHAQDATSLVTQSDIALVTDLAAGDNSGGTAEDHITIIGSPAAGDNADVDVDVEGQVYHEVEESSYPLDPSASVSTGYSQGGDGSDGAPLAISFTEEVVVQGIQETWSDRQGNGTVYEILPVKESYEAIYADDRHHNDESNNRQTHVHGHGSVHLDVTIDAELEGTVQEEGDVHVEEVDIVLTAEESSEPAPYTELHTDEGTLTTEQQQHTDVDIKVDVQIESERSTTAPAQTNASQVTAESTVVEESQEVDVDVSMKVDVESNPCEDEHVLNDTTVAKDALTLIAPSENDDDAAPRKNKIKVRVYETRETAMVICDDPNCPDPDHHIDHDVEIDQSLVIGNVTSGRIVQLDVHEFQRASVERDGKEIEVDIDIDLKKELGLEGIPLLVSEKDGNKEVVIIDSDDGGKSGGHKRMRLKELVETTMIEEETGSDSSTTDPTGIKVDIDVSIDDDGKETGKLVVVGSLENQERPPGSHGSMVVHVNERIETVTVEEECIDGDDHDKVSVILPGDIPIKDGESVTIIRRPSRTSPVVPGQPVVRPPGRWMVTTDTTLVRPNVRPPIPIALVGPRPVMQRPIPGGFVRPAIARPMVVAPRPVAAAPRPMVMAPRPMIAAPKPLVVPPRPLVAAPRVMVNAARGVMVAPRPMMVRPRPILVRPPQRVIAPRPHAIVRPMLRPVPRPAPRVTPAPVMVPRPQLRPVQRSMPAVRVPPPRPIVALRPPMAVRPPPAVVMAPPVIVAAPPPVVAAPAPVMAMPGPTMMAQPPMAVMGPPPMMSAGPQGGMVRSNANMVSSQEVSGPGLAALAGGRGGMVRLDGDGEHHSHLHAAATAAAVVEGNGHANRSSMHPVNDETTGDGFIRSTDVDPDLDRYVHMDRHESPNIYQDNVSHRHRSEVQFQQEGIVEQHQHQHQQRNQEVIAVGEEDQEMEYLVQDVQLGIPPQLRELSIETYYDTTKSQKYARERQPIPVLGFQDAPLGTAETPSNLAKGAVEATTAAAGATAVVVTVPARTVQTPPPVLSFPKPPSNPPPVKLLANRGAAAAVATAAATAGGAGGGRVLKSESEAIRSDHPLLRSPQEITQHSTNIEHREKRRTTFQLPSVPPSHVASTEDVHHSGGSGGKRPNALARSLISQSILANATTTVGGGDPAGGERGQTSSVPGSTALLMPEVKLRPRPTKDRKVKRPKSAMPMSRHHLHPSLLREGVMATWNNEFEAALTILEDYKEVYPRWSLAAAEVLIVQQLFSGQLSEPDEQLNEALQLSEKVATKVLEKKEFEPNYMDYRSFCTADITLATTNDSTLRQNYKWDCEMALYHTLLYRGILQITSASDTKGAFSDIKGGLQLRRAWRGYQRIKQEMALAKEKWLKLKAYEAKKDHQLHDPPTTTAAGKPMTSELPPLPKTQMSIEPAPISSNGGKTPGRSQSAKAKKPPPPSSNAKRASVLSTSQPNEASSVPSSTGSRWSVFGKRSSWNPLGANQGQGQGQDADEPLEEMTVSSFPNCHVSGGGVASALREQAKAAADLRNAVEVLEDVEDTMTYGIGLFYFILSIVPKSFHPVLKTIGLQPDHEQGIQNLERIFERRNSQAPFAALFLMINYLFLPRGIADPSISLDRAGVILNRCLKSCPNGSCFLLMACHHSRKLGHMIPTALNHITRGIQTCEASGIPSINYRFEMGLTFFIDQQFAKAADIFEILWRRYLTSQQNQALIGTSAQDGDIRGPNGKSSNSSGGDSNTSVEEYEEDEFELAPFCGLCLIACKVVVRLGQVDYFGFTAKRDGSSASMPQSNTGGAGAGAKDPQIRGSSQPKLTPLSMAASGSSGYEFDLMTAAQEVLGMMADSPLDAMSTVKTNASSSQAPAGKGKLNKFNKFAWIQCRKALERGRVSPFLPLIILYLRRDVAYMKPSLLRKFHQLLESALKSVPQPPDADSQAVYLLLNGVIHRELLPDDPTIAYTSFTDCLLLDSLIESETWVIPYCHYELGELLYKRLHLVQEAKDQFSWVLKGPGKGPRSSIYASTATNPRLSMMGLVGSGPFSEGINDPPIMGHVSQPSVSSLASNPRFSQLFGNTIPTSPTAPSFQTPQALYLARYKKFEFSQSLRQRCVVAVDQIDKILEQRQQQ